MTSKPPFLDVPSASVHGAELTESTVSIDDPASIEDTAFVYGTLQVPAVLERVLGRVPPLRPAELRHYRRRRVSRECYPAVVPTLNETVLGSVLYELRETDWQSLDAYEGSLYTREHVAVAVDGQTRTVQCYVLRPEYAHLLGDEAWSLEQFVERELAVFLAELDDE